MGAADDVVQPAVALVAAGQPMPCLVRPYANLVHLDGVCGCFYDGPRPEFAAPPPPAAG